jgi:hypothetical protein
MSDPQGQAGPDGLVELVDQLERLLNESELSELEVEAGSTALVLRKPNAFAAHGRQPPGRRHGPPTLRHRQPRHPRRRLTAHRPTRCWRR